MAIGTGKAISIDDAQIRATIEALKDARREIGPAAVTATREMRKAAREISRDIIVPALLESGNASSIPIAPAMAATARAVNDRIPVVKVGYVMPKLSGFKRMKADKKYARGSLAWGSEFGPKGGRRKPGRAGWKAPSAPVNHYKTPRNESGNWITPTIRRASVVNDVLDAYRIAAIAIFRRNGVI